MQGIVDGVSRTYGIWICMIESWDNLLVTGLAERAEKAELPDPGIFCSRTCVLSCPFFLSVCVYGMDVCLVCGSRSLT